MRRRYPQLQCQYPAELGLRGIVVMMNDDVIRLQEIHY